MNNYLQNLYDEILRDFPVDNEDLKTLFEDYSNREKLAFGYIKDWRETFNLPVRTRPQIPSKEEICLGYSLIAEETHELLDALYPSEGKNISLNEVADAIGDLYFVVSQMAFIFGFKPEELIKTVYESNMSKICINEEDTAATIKKYGDLGIQTTIQHTSNGAVIHRASDNKVLKGVNFFEPKWTYDESRTAKETK